MPHPSFPCPYCSAPLRIRNRKLIGKQLACPDCGNPILIASAGPRELSLQKVQSVPHSRTARKKTVRKRAKPGRLSRWLSVLQSPVGIAWSVAGFLAVMLLLAAWPFGDSSSQDRTSLQNTKERPSAEKSDQEKLSDINDENLAAGQSEQAFIVEQTEGIDGDVDRKNDFPLPVVAGGVRQLGLPTHGTGGHRRRPERMMCSTGTRPGLGCLLCWEHRGTRAVERSSAGNEKTERSGLWKSPKR